MGLEALAEKLKKIKKGVIEKADQGIQSVKSSSEEPGIAEVGKEVLKEASGLKARLIKEGTNFVKTYMKDNVAKENPTGATLGAFGEYMVKKTVKGVKTVVGAVTDYIADEATKYHKIDALPELEAAKALVNEYAQDGLEQGEEELNYKGIGLFIKRTEKDLSINLKSKQKTIELTYLLKDVEISDLNNNFEVLTEDLLKRLDKLSDPTTVRIDKTMTLKLGLPQKKGEQTYMVHAKKAEGAYEVSYTPENKKTGIMLKYVLQKSEPEVQTQEE